MFFINLPSCCQLALKSWIVCLWTTSHYIQFVLSENVTKFVFPKLHMMNNFFLSFFHIFNAHSVFSLVPLSFSYSFLLSHCYSTSEQFMFSLFKSRGIFVKCFISKIWVSFHIYDINVWDVPKTTCHCYNLLFVEIIFISFQIILQWDFKQP